MREIIIMKNILRILLLFTALIVTAQSSNENKIFYINNNQVHWQKIYNSDKNLDQIKNILSSSGKIKFTGQTDNSLSGEVDNFIMDFKGAGFSKISTPMYLSPSSKYHAVFVIKFKDGKYKVDVSGVTLKGVSLSIYGDGLAIGDDGNDVLETFVLYNDRKSFRGRFEGKEAKIIDHSFSSLFDVSQYTTNEENW